ncbi:MAG: hypothetical protein WCW40_11465 [Bacteroidota bacterium]
MIDQIAHFIDVLRAAEGSPQRVLFSLRKFPSSTEFILSGDRLLYNKNIKLFHKILRDLLYGTVDVSSTSIGHLPAEPILFFDVHQFVWEAVSRISDEDITAICKEMELITVAKTSHPVKDFSLFSRDSIDSIVVFYFQLLPKPANVFLQDFETTNRIHYYRSLIRMALLDYIKLDSPSVVPVGAMEEHIPSPQTILPTSVSAPTQEPVEEQTVISPLEKIIEKSQIEEGIDKQIDRILREKPVVQLPVEKKKDGKNIAISKARIDNLKKILRNIKQL